MPLPVKLSDEQLRQTAASIRRLAKVDLVNLAMVVHSELHDRMPDKTGHSLRYITPEGTIHFTVVSARGNTSRESLARVASVTAEIGLLIATKRRRRKKK